MQVTAHKQGTPSWFELSTSDETAAAGFYGALFGWTDDPQPVPEGAPYHMQRIDGASVAGISHQMPNEEAQNIPPHWNVFITVDDLEAVAGKVAGAGGSTMMPPFDVMDMGRMAVIADPTGGIVCLWEAKQHIGAERMYEPGAPAWAELMTSDPAKAAAFLEDLLGVEAGTGDVPAGAPPYRVLKAGGEEVAGIRQLMPEEGRMPTAWTAYFGVEDVDASVEKAQSLGGSVLVPPTDIPDGRFAVLMDPQQAAFGVLMTNQA